MLDKLLNWIFFLITLVCVFSTFVSLINQNWWFIILGGIYIYSFFNFVGTITYKNK